jgi:glycosyltransferase involved in cell wall biosynthesis
MLAMVIPARNEAARIDPVIRQGLRLGAGLIIPVLNGCDDMSAEVVRRIGDKRVRPLTFKEPLGYDVPRIAGARQALQQGALGVIFVDADLGGPIFGALLALADQVRRGALDLALCDCYAGTPVPFRKSAAAEVYQARLRFNRALKRPDLGPAIPSHGPVAVSRRLLEQVPEASIGVPPLMQAHACLAGLKVDVVARIPHRDLGSAKRDPEHGISIAETIIGDCLQGMCLAEGREADRQGHIGYHHQRRFELLSLVPPAEYGHTVSV